MAKSDNELDNLSPSFYELERRLRGLLPADLYADVWMTPNSAVLMQAFSHLRTLRRILYDYLPRQISETLPPPGETHYSWKTGTLMFTDLAGFTPLVAAYTGGQGKEKGAKELLQLLNDYFSEMLEIISKSGGNLLEFTGDAVLAEFPESSRANATLQAVRAGLRMQRAMELFGQVEVNGKIIPFGMRVGIHYGRFVTADIGTPRRMDQVLLGDTVHETKLAESAGRLGRVCVTKTALAKVEQDLRWEESETGRHAFIIDDLTDDELGEYEIAPVRRRLPSMLVTDRSVNGLLQSLNEAVDLVEPVASYLPSTVLNLVVANAKQRQVPAQVTQLFAMFVNLIGITEYIDEATPEEQDSLVNSFSHLFAQVNAQVEIYGGVLKKVTYHLVGSDLIIYFGSPNAHMDDHIRAAKTALAIRDVVTGFEGPLVHNKKVEITCKIGMSLGLAFVGEVGARRGRREMNIHGDAVNVAARLMGLAQPNQILITREAHQAVGFYFDCEDLGEIALKGKKKKLEVFALKASLK
ncbi:MAG TPA: adenylate/guanylate cyclase domain-containing protein [Anaerolineae bacterium]|nr:adenylate/guanylate cyclase domain-containing protein [Anaerolineae bacterium]